MDAENSPKPIVLQERPYRRKRTGRVDSDNFEFVGPSKKALRPRNPSSKSKQHSGSSNSKNRSRRSIFKKNPTKLAPPSPFLRLEARFMHKGMWLQLGDIVSITDVDGGQYYAQLRNIIIDKSENASVILTWLVPTTEATPGKFEASKYIIGMEEDTPRDIDCCSFVCRCPSDYFRPVDSPYTIQSWSFQPSALSN